MFKKIYLGFLILLTFAFFYLAFITFRPIRNVTLDDVAPTQGKVISVSKKEGDLYITLTNDPHHYYVKSFQRRHQLDFSEVEQAILEKEITLHYINKWTPLTTDSVYPHISRITLNGTFIFNEIKE